MPRFGSALRAPASPVRLRVNAVPSLDAVTLAFRGASLISAISPKKSPSLRRAMILLPRMTSTDPARSRKNAAPLDPSLMTSRPSFYDCTLPSLLSVLRCFSVAPENKGTAASASARAFSEYCCVMQAMLDDVASACRWDARLFG